jgi:hypothetical protein
MSTTIVRLRSKSCSVNLSNETHARLVVEAYRRAGPTEDVRDRMAAITELVLVKYLDECDEERDRAAGPTP